LQVVVILGVWEFCEEPHKVGVGVQTVGFGGFNDEVQAGARLGAARRAGKKPIFSADDKGSYGVLREIV
jgi:hypothetical protein